MPSRLIIGTVAVCLFTSPAFAGQLAFEKLVTSPASVDSPIGSSRTGVVAQQTPSSDRATLGLVKMIVGLGLVGSGALLAATSGYSSDICIVEPFLGRTCANISARNSSQLVSGIGAAGAGAFLVWWGAKDRQVPASPSVVSVGVGNGIRVTYGRRW